MVNDFNSFYILEMSLNRKSIEVKFIVNLIDATTEWCSTAIEVIKSPRKKSPRKKSTQKIPLNAVERKPVPTRVHNPNASEASYKSKQRSYRKMKLKKIIFLFFREDFVGGILSGKRFFTYKYKDEKNEIGNLNKIGMLTHIRRD